MAITWSTSGRETRNSDHRDYGQQEARIFCVSYQVERNEGRLPNESVMIHSNRPHYAAHHPETQGAPCCGGSNLKLVSFVFSMYLPWTLLIGLTIFMSFHGDKLFAPIATLVVLPLTFFSLVPQAAFGGNLPKLLAALIILYFVRIGTCVLVFVLVVALTGAVIHCATWIFFDIIIFICFIRTTFKQSVES